MSRIGKQPVDVPSGVTVEESGRTLKVKGPKGALEITVRPEISTKIEGNQIEFDVTGQGPARAASAFQGLTRSLVANMVTGVTKGFTKDLEIQGVGWNAQAQGKKLTLNIGFCHPVYFDLPEGIEVQTPQPTVINVSGIDKQAVGEFAARVRRVRPPEPYKGKGIRYKGEFVRRKAGKSFGS